MAGAGWFYRVGERTVGPLSEEGLVTALFYQRIVPATLVWRDGVQPASLQSVFELSVIAPPALPDDLAAPETPATPPSGSAALWITAPVYPWRRHFARILDLSLLGAIGAACFGMVLGVLAPSINTALWEVSNPLMAIFQNTIVCILTTIPSALIIATTGGTPGKWFFGVRVARGDGRALGVIVALRREFSVLVRGMAFGVPLFFLVTALVSRAALLSDQTTHWDKMSGAAVSYRRPGALTVTRQIIGVALIVCAAALSRALVAQGQ
ncbi:MAG: RDD family protein [Hyphomonadaceae bacterium]|nr:RDD family protein [Hyphomonadaceae bacterium]